jgi:hypothetical protein
MDRQSSLGLSRPSNIFLAFRIQTRVFGLVTTGVKYPVTFSVAASSSDVFLGPMFLLPGLVISGFVCQLDLGQARNVHIYFKRLHHSNAHVLAFSSGRNDSLFA